MMEQLTHSRSTARVFSWLMTFALLLSLLALPAQATAPSGALSAELVFSSEGTELSGKIALDPEHLLLGAIAEVRVNGVSTANLNAYLSSQALAVASNLLGGAYGTDFAALTQNLPKSIFAPNSGSSYALDEETYDQIMATLNGGLESLTQSHVPSVDAASIDLTEELAVLAETYSGIGDALMSCLIVDVKDASLVINSEPIQVQQGSVTIDSEALASILYVLITPLQGNPEAQNALAAVIDGINASSSEELGVTGEEAVEMLVSQLPEMLPELVQELEESNFAISLVLCFVDGSSVPVKLGMEISDNTERVELSLLMNEELNYFRFELNEDGVVNNYIQLDISENSSKALAFQLTIQSEYEDPVTVDFHLNKAGKAFLLNILADGENVSLSGYYTSSDTLFSITIDKVNGQNLDGSLTLNLRSDDAISIPTFTEITTMTEAEFTTLLEQASNVIALFSEMM